MHGQIIPLRPFGDDDHDIEGKLVGAVLELPDKLELIESSGLVRDDFANPRAAIAWTIIRRMAERRLEITAATVCSAGKRAHMLSDGDLQWLSALQEANLLTTSQTLQIAEDVRVAARARGIRSQLMEQVQVIDRGHFSPARALGSLEGIITSLATDFAADETADVDLMELNAQWDDNEKKGQSVLEPTGIRVLDEILGGGAPRNLWIIQGKPGAGKNALLSTLIRAQLMLDADSPTPSRTGLFGLESGTSWLTRRWQAEDLDIPLKLVGDGRHKLSREMAERKAGVIDPMHDRLLKRVEIYRRDGAPRTELVRRALRWIFKCGVTRLFVDNLREVKPDPRSRLQYFQEVAETIGAFRGIGWRYGVSTCLLVHDMEETTRTEGPPDPKKMQGGSDPGARARAVVGLWRKGNTFRATVTKNEMGEARYPNGPTCEFQFNFAAATVHATSGRVLDLGAEEAKETRESSERSLEKSITNSLRRAELKAQREADLKTEVANSSPSPEPPAQASLLDVQKSPKPEGS